MRQVLLVALLSSTSLDLTPLPVIEPGLPGQDVLIRYPQLRPYEPIDGPSEPHFLVGRLKVDLDGVNFYELTVSLDPEKVHSAALSYEVRKPVLDAGRGRRPDRALYEVVQRHLEKRLGKPTHQAKCLRIWRTESFLVVHEIGRVKYEQKKDLDVILGAGERNVDPFCWE